MSFTIQFYISKKQAKTLNLSGGISTTDDITTTPDDTTIIDEVSCVIIFFLFLISMYKVKKRNIFDYLESIEKDSLVAASNMDNDPYAEDNGLIAGHAYSVEDFES